MKEFYKRYFLKEDFCPERMPEQSKTGYGISRPDLLVPVVDVAYGA